MTTKPFGPSVTGESYEPRVRRLVAQCTSDFHLVHQAQPGLSLPEGHYFVKILTRNWYKYGRSTR